MSAIFGKFYCSPHAPLNTQALALTIINARGGPMSSHLRHDARTFSHALITHMLKRKAAISACSKHLCVIGNHWRVFFAPIVLSA
jgi:hypothetical protein